MPAMTALSMPDPLPSSTLRLRRLTLGATSRTRRMEELSPCTDESGGMSAAPILIGGDGVNRNEAALVGHPRILSWKSSRSLIWIRVSETATPVPVPASGEPSVMTEQISWLLPAAGPLERGDD